MLRDTHKLEILLGDFECRYGVGHPISLEIRASLPKFSRSTSVTSGAGLSRQKQNTAIRFKRVITTPG
jgi:hypothetical protein